MDVHHRHVELARRIDYAVVIGGVQRVGDWPAAVEHLLAGDLGRDAFRQHLRFVSLDDRRQTEPGF